MYLFVGFGLLFMLVFIVIILFVVGSNIIKGLFDLIFEFI